MPEKIFITGVAGLIGSNVAKYFLKEGWEVYGVDNLVGGYCDNIPEKVHFKPIDILNRPALCEFMQKANCYFYVHCAALAYEGLSVFSPKLITENIYAGTISVASAAIRAKGRHIIFLNCSSMARYGNLIPPFVEEDFCNPVDPYGMAKYHAEQQLNLLTEIYEGFRVYHVVPHNVVGPGQVYNDPYRNVVSIMINRLLLNKSIYIYGDGSQVRSFSHVNDCVNAIAQLLWNSAKNKSVYNIGPDGNEISIHELAMRLGKIIGLDPIIEFLPPRPREVPLAYCDSTKAKRELNYKITKSLDETLEEMVLWIKRQKPSDAFRYNLDLEIITNDTPKTWTNKLF